MKSIYIENIFEDYLNIKDSNYALLINGAWGSGKTFFWKNKLEKIATKKKLTPIYLSLNGISKIETLDYYLKIKLIPFLASLDVKKSASIGKILKNISTEFIKGKYNVDAENILKDIDIDLTLFSNKIICLDDLERSKIPLPEILGYINNFVEHKNLKVVFLSDESKIIDNDPNYNSIKEKVIGRILNFKNDLKDTFPMLLEKYKDIDMDFYSFMNSKSPMILTFLEDFKEENLRNITFYIGNLHRLYNSFKKHIDYADEIILFSLIITLEFKLGKLISNDYLDYRGYDDIVINSIFFNINKPQNNGYLVTNEVEEKATKSDLEVFYEKYIKSNSDYYFFYPSIYRYILTGYLEELELENELKSRYPYIAPDEEVTFDKLLKNNFRNLLDEEFTLLSEKILIYAKEGKYNIYEYIQISNYFIYFVKSKLISQSIEEINDILKTGIEISKFKNYSDKKVFDSICHFRTKDEDSFIFNIVEKAHQEIEKSKDSKKVNKLIYAISQRETEEMEKIFLEFQHSTLLFQYLEPKILFSELEFSSNKILSEFNELIEIRYNPMNIKDFLNSDKNFLVELNFLINNTITTKSSFKVKDLLFKELSDKLDIIIIKILS